MILCLLSTLVAWWAYRFACFLSPPSRLPWHHPSPLLKNRSLGHAFILFSSELSGYLVGEVTLHIINVPLQGWGLVDFGEERRTGEENMPRGMEVSFRLPPPQGHLVLPSTVPFRLLSVGVGNTASHPCCSGRLLLITT